MLRKTRYFVPGLPVHVVCRGYNRQTFFFEASDYQAYLRGGL
jgi:REP element-mobilizing transposase RayT